MRNFANVKGLCHIFVKNVKFAKNQYGTWVINENGEVVFSAYGLLKDTYGDISSDKSKIYYVERGI